MEITEVRIKLMEEAGDRLQAFCSITFDNCFVVRDLKIIEGTTGPFVAMPSRKLTIRCGKCGCKNHLRAPYCNQCGSRQPEDRTSRDENGRAKLYADIAHPINSTCREMIQDRIIKAFHEELDRANMPGYVSSYEDFDHDDFVPEPAQAPQAEPAERDVPARPAAAEKTHVQAAESHPRRPHAAPSQQSAPPPPNAPNRQSTSTPHSQPTQPRTAPSQSSTVPGQPSTPHSPTGAPQKYEDFGSGIF